VFACKNVIAQAIATMPVSHLRLRPDGGREVIDTSPLHRILRQPNEYQTRSDFFLNLAFELLGTGNAPAVVFRDDAMRVSSVHLLPWGGTQPYVSADGAVFYGVGHNPMLGELDALIPARDIMHVRLYTPQHPLIGVSPVQFATLAVQVNTAIGSNQAGFFSNMSRPSGVLTTEEKLTKLQMDELRDAWYARSRGLATGEVPILGWGLKWNPMTITSQDAQLIEAYRMSIEDIARVYRVPLSLIGEYNKATYNNTEQLISQWLATGLGFVMEHLEQSLSKLFRLPADETVQFDADALLRTDFQARVEALTKGITGGLYSPNEARRREGLPEVEYGDEPRLQAQVVPLSQVGMEPAESAPTAPAAPAAQVTDENALPATMVKSTLPFDAQCALLREQVNKLMATGS
jgi:HK97 family phage portal protein